MSFQGFGQAANAAFQGAGNVTDMLQRQQASARDAEAQRRAGAVLRMLAMAQQQQQSGQQPGGAPSMTGQPPAGGVSPQVAGGPPAAGAPGSAGPVPPGGAPAMPGMPQGGGQQDQMQQVLRLLASMPGNDGANMGAASGLSSLFLPQQRLQDMLMRSVYQQQETDNRLHETLDSRREIADSNNTTRESIAGQNNSTRRDVAGGHDKTIERGQDMRADTAADSLLEKAREADKRSMDTRYSVDQRQKSAKEGLAYRKQALAMRKQMADDKLKAKKTDQPDALTAPPDSGFVGKPALDPATNQPLPDGTIADDPTSGAAYITKGGVWQSYK